jgi:hypothetical protein
MSILQNMAMYSTKRISKQLITEVSKALKSIDAYGSVELYVQDSNVTQITVRNIKKTNGITPTK